VVVPAYNAAATLGEQLEALAAQPYEGDWELVVVDNGSTDGTADLARRHHRRFPAFTLVDGGLRRGHSAPRNAGARAARGELLGLLRRRRRRRPRLAPGHSRRGLPLRPGRRVAGRRAPERRGDPLLAPAMAEGPAPVVAAAVRGERQPRRLGRRAPGARRLVERVRGRRGGHRLSWRAQLAGLRLGFAPDVVVYYRYRPGLWQTARQAYGIGVNCEHILHDYRFLRDEDHPGAHLGVVGPGDGDGSALGRALGRTAWLATRLPYLAGSRRHRGQWVSVAGEFLGRLTGAARYRLPDSGRP
jgi:hypothetical protein